VKSINYIIDILIYNPKIKGPIYTVWFRKCLCQFDCCKWSLMQKTVSTFKEYFLIWMEHVSIPNYLPSTIQKTLCSLYSINVDFINFNFI